MSPAKSPTRPAPTAAAEFYYYARRIEATGEFSDDQWCQNSLARNAAGQNTAVSVDPVDPKRPGPPVQFCAMGHLYRICATPAEETDIPIMTALLTRQLTANGAAEALAQWNDAPERRAQEVRELFQQTAAHLYRQAVQRAAAETAATPTGHASAAAQPQPAAAH